MSISMSIFPILNIRNISLKIEISISCLLDILFAKVLAFCDIVMLRGDTVEVQDESSELLVALTHHLKEDLTKLRK